MTLIEQQTNGKTEIKPIGARKISLACGDRKPDGYFGIDIIDTEACDLVWDLFEFPWPIKSNCATDISMEHFIEHVPHWRPGWTKDGFFLVLEEIYRICKKDAVVEIVHPYVMNGRAFWDPTHTRFIHEATWAYCDREWRDREMLGHYDFNVDFEQLSIDGIGIADNAMTRNHEQQQFMREHYWNVVQDLIVKLRARK